MSPPPIPAVGPAKRYDADLVKVTGPVHDFANLYQQALLNMISLSYVKNKSGNMFISVTHISHRNTIDPHFSGIRVAFESKVSFLGIFYF